MTNNTPNTTLFLMNNAPNTTFFLTNNAAKILIFFEKVAIVWRKVEKKNTQEIRFSILFSLFPLPTLRRLRKRWTANAFIKNKAINMNKGIGHKLNPIPFYFITTLQYILFHDRSGNWDVNVSEYSNIRNRRCCI